MSTPSASVATGLLTAPYRRGAETLDLVQHIDKGRFAVTRGLGKVSAAPDRLAGGGEKHGQLPAALLAQMMQRRHVDLIDVGAFLAIDFDVDE